MTVRLAETAAATPAVRVLPTQFNNVAEFRHPGWWDGKGQGALARHHVAFVGPSYPPPLELPDEVVAHADGLCSRFHGVPEPYKSPCSPEFLARIAGEVRAAKHVKYMDRYLTQRHRGRGREKCPADAAVNASWALTPRLTPAFAAGMANFHIGCSGYHYRHWRGRFYPEKLPVRLWFDYYSQHFRTLELNVTFYRFPQLSFLENWYRQSPADFLFSVKAPKLITHYKQFNNVQQLMSDFYDTTARGLLEKLGPVLFQLPPRTAYAPDRLARILDCLDPAFLNVLEFRHPSWWQPEVYDQLARRNVIFCGQSHPQLPDVVVATAPTLYYRFHGVPDLYRSPYDQGFLHRIADEIQAQSCVQQAYAYFNNDIDASAIGNARAMLAMV